MSSSQLKNKTIDELTRYKITNLQKLDLWKKRTVNCVEFELVTLYCELTLIYALKNKRVITDQESFRFILSEATNETVEKSDLINTSYNKLIDKFFYQPIINKYSFVNKRVNVGLIDVRIKQLLQKKNSLQIKLEIINSIYQQWTKNLNESINIEKIESISI